jgi:AcrR family transcriptional regulator
MMHPPDLPATGRGPALERLLEAADRVFYGEGIHATPVDRVITETGVTRATFYRHFRSKEDLVVAYVERRDQAIRTAAHTAARAATDPAQLLLALIDGVAAEVCQPGFRGCPFINAAAEYPDPDHPVRRAVADHRAWFHGALAEALSGTRHSDPQSGARTLAMLRDGAMVAGYLEDPDTVRVHLAHATETFLANA